MTPLNLNNKKNHRQFNTKNSGNFHDWACTTFGKNNTK